MNRQTFFYSLPLEQYSPEDLRRIQLAYWLAKEGHRTQHRDDGERYFEHPRAVALILVEMGYTDVSTICAALLHDGVEDTYILPDAYLALVGPTVWNWVFTLSKKIPAFDPVTGVVIDYVKRDQDKYFEGIAALPPQARVIKLADRLHNLRTCGVMKEDRKQRYIHETRSLILPIAQSTDPNFVQVIEHEIKLVLATCKDD